MCARLSRPPPCPACLCFGIFADDFSGLPSTGSLSQIGHPSLSGLALAYLWGSCWVSFSSKPTGPRGPACLGAFLLAPRRWHMPEGTPAGHVPIVPPSGPWPPSQVCQTLLCPLNHGSAQLPGLHPRGTSPFSVGSTLRGCRTVDHHPLNWNCLHSISTLRVLFRSFHG